MVEPISATIAAAAEAAKIAVTEAAKEAAKECVTAVSKEGLKRAGKEIGKEALKMGVSEACKDSPESKPIVSLGVNLLLGNNLLGAFESKSDISSEGLKSSKVKGSEDKKETSSSESKIGFYQVLSDLYDSKKFKEAAGKVLEENPKLKQALQDAVERDDAQQIGSIRGRIMEKIIVDKLESAFNNIKTEVASEAKDGRGTRIDVTAQAQKEVFYVGKMRKTIKPGETLAIEIKCGQKGYLVEQTKVGGKVEKQTQGHIGDHSIILVSKDFNEIDKAKAEEIRARFKESDSSIYAAILPVEVIDSRLKSLINEK